MKNNKTLGLLIAVLLFLGFSPINEPHIFGKINWIKGGANGMSGMDWFDAVLHGGALIAAFILIIYLIYSILFKK